MVSITVVTGNKDTYKPSVQDIMDKYYEMFRGKNQGKKIQRLKQKSLSSSTVPRMLMTRTQIGEQDLEEVGC